LINELIKDAKM